MIGHYGPGVAFADLIRKGAEAAAAKDNIELRFSTDPDAPTQANLVQSAIDSKVDGIAVTLAKPDAMAPAVKAAIAAGIPVVGFNAGFTDWQAMGIKEFFGQDETIAGREAGSVWPPRAPRRRSASSTTGQRLLETRCAGIKEGLGGGEMENLYVNGNDMTAVAATITAKLQQDPSIDHIATLYSGIGMAALQAKGSTGSNATIVTFDTDAQLSRRDQGQEDRVDRRPATLLAGLSGRGLPVAVPEQPQHHRRRGAHSDWAGVHRRIEHRRDRGVRATRHSMTVPPTR
jgi:simple sugar transport system substrate-binding protein